MYEREPRRKEGGFVMEKQSSVFGGMGVKHRQMAIGDP